jgi:hypothetical protein
VVRTHQMNIGITKMGVHGLGQDDRTFISTQ